MRAEPERRLVRLVDTGSAEHLSVRDLRAALTVDGPLLHSQLHITFTNELGRAVEGDLVFPLSPSAALRGLTVRCGERTLKARIRPRERAQAEYARARAAGQTAALGESEGEDLLRVRVAPIAAGEDVVVSLEIVALLMPTSDGHRLVLPLTYMPRFVEDPAALKDTERAAVDRPRPLTLAARANVTLTVRHDRQELRPTLRCATHALRSEALPTETVATLGPLPLDRDLQIDISEPRSNGRTAGAMPLLWLRHDPGPGPDGLGSATAVAVLPPAYADEGATVARTVVLLVDRSGSMSGAPMEAAIRAVRGCLRALQPGDHFNIVAFDDQLEALAGRPLAFDDKALSAADSFISGISARGGTEASKAMTAVLRDDLPGGVHASVAMPERPTAAHRLRVVVFMTDGDVAGAEGVLQAAKRELVDTRLHVIGIGESVQHALLAQLARLGGGTYTPVATSEDLEKALARLKSAIDAPLWTGVQASVEAEGQVTTPQQLEPEGRLDLFAGQPLLLAWRGGPEPGALSDAASRWQVAAGPYRSAPQPGEVRLRLSGQTPGGEDRRLFARLPAADRRPEDAGGAMTLWALLRAQRLTYRYEASDDAALEALGVDFGLANRKVALVAVDQEQRDVEVSGSVPVSLPLPRNLASGAHMTRAGAMVGGAPPPMMQAMAMPAPSRPAPRMSMNMAARGGPPVPASPPAPSMAPGAAKPSLSRMMDEEADGLAEGAPPAAEKAKKGIGARLRSLFSGGPGGAPPTPAPEPVMMASLDVADAPEMESDDDLYAAVGARAAAPAPAAERDELANAGDDEATLRALLLRQRADGLFDGDLAATLAAVAVLVGRGHTAREGLFRGELRRTAMALRQLLGQRSGVEQQYAALALALLTVPGGEAPPSELAPATAAALAGLELSDLTAARRRISAALATVSGWQDQPLARSLRGTFHLT